MSVELDRAEELCGLTLGLPQVGPWFDGSQQQVVQLPALGRGQPRERRAGGLHAGHQLSPGRDAFRGEAYPLHPPVVGVLIPFDQAAGGETVDEPGGG